uniref:Uncharacterized protein n=1 Tax=Arundo donax TaxID=35708 RepID=A0A0A8YHT2_ARUDO
MFVWSLIWGLEYMHVEQEEGSRTRCSSPLARVRYTYVYRVGVYAYVCVATVVTCVVCSIG